MRNTFVNTLLEHSINNRDTMLMTGDLGYGVLTEYWEKCPKQFINAGICEQNMTSVAAGLALEGKKVFTYSIANFPTLRALEQIRNDVAYHKADVNIVSVGAGFAYGGLGMSHHATEDIAIMRSLPEMIIFTPCDPIETEQVTNIACEISSPCYIRLGRGGEKTVYKEVPKMELGKANVVRDGKDAVIFVSGAIIIEAVEAAEILDKSGISCAIYSFPCVKPIDEKLILDVAKSYDDIITLEEHNVVGGFGSAVAEVMAKNNADAKLLMLGLRDEYTSIVGSQSYLREAYCIDSKYICKTIFDIINKKSVED